MSVLYLMETGACLRRDGDALLVTLPPDKNGHTESRKILRQHLQQVFICGNTHITTEALHLCLGEGVSVAWLTAGGKLVGMVRPPISGTPEPRMLQYKKCGRDSSLFFARQTVLGKIRSECRVLRLAQSNSPHPLIAQTLTRLKTFEAEAHDAKNAPTLRGVEGNAATAYFSVLSALSSQLPFTRRTRRPPKDAFNALLSFGYAHIAMLTSSLLEVRGLDPYFGFFHVLRAGRASLALDIMEEFRAPVADRFTLRAGNLRILRPEHFMGEKGGYTLTESGRKIFYKEWEKFLTQPLPAPGKGKISLREALFGQVEKFIAALRGEAQYSPFHTVRKPSSCGATSSVTT